MLTPSLPRPDERGKQWLQRQVQQLLAASAVALAPPRSEDDAACLWGIEPKTGTTSSSWKIRVEKVLLWEENSHPIS